MNRWAGIAIACGRPDGDVGARSPGPEAALKVLYQVHDESKVEEAQKQLQAGQLSYIAEESAAQRGLAQVKRKRCKNETCCADHKVATINLDSTIMKSHNREAQPMYQGGSG